MRYGSVCSGIEAATVAWHSLGWTPSWFSEIDSFPSAVLDYHWSKVNNLGDMTLIPFMLDTRLIEAPDVLVGGTPCQAFSLAGLRKGLDDERGQLTLSYVQILNKIDEVRKNRGQPAAIGVWENVPGVLSSRDNAFGFFLAGLSGESVALEPPGGKWANAGYVSGPDRNLAWRVLNSKYFGVAQHRRRVFVIASARNDFCPGKVLFEQESLSGNLAKNQNQKRQSTGSPVGTAGTTSRWWNGGQVSQTLDAVLAKGQMMPEKNRFPCVIYNERLRRITPTESERLQGFPDGHTLIPYRGKWVTDTPRYKAVGNSMTVPVMNFIGRRIQLYADASMGTL